MNGEVSVFGDGYSPRGGWQEGVKGVLQDRAIKQQVMFSVGNCKSDVGGNMQSHADT